MQIDAWNDALAARFLDEGLHRPAYLSTTAAELQRMNDDLNLGLADIVEDLRVAVGRATYHYGMRRHSDWQRSNIESTPPWLAFLAASVLVVEQQTDAGSIGFYTAFSKFLGLSQRLTQREYEESFYRWWGWLAAWLENTHEGRRGYPTWRGIPESGPRTVIGHPYTQVLLLREDRRGLEAFLADFSAEHGDPPELIDRLKAGLHLVSALRRWASGHRMLSPRLRSILEGGSDSAVESLAYMLLDRLFDQRSETDETSVRRISVVPALDELDRELHLAAIGPAWVSLDNPLVLDECISPMDSPGQPSYMVRPPTDAVLDRGLVVELGQLTLIAHGREVHALARRDWDLWCGVRTVERDEKVYLLGGASLELRLQSPPSRRTIKDMPPGWAVFGPLTYTPELERRAGVALMARERRLVPRLRGGLALDGQRSYLVGGEPTVELPGVGEDVAVDGTRLQVEEDELRLNRIGLGAGEHVIEAGPFRIGFTSITAARLPHAVAAFGRTRTGELTAPDGRSSLVSGLRLLPERAQRGAVWLTPVVESVTLLGVPGEVGIVEVTRAGWADRLDLPLTAVEMAALSSYPGRDRVVKFPVWLAWSGPDGWTIAQWGLGEPGDDLDPGRWLEPADWQLAVEEIGPDPMVFQFESQPATPVDAVLRKWREYTHRGRTE